MCVTNLIHKTWFVNTFRALKRNLFRRAYPCHFVLTDWWVQIVYLSNIHSTPCLQFAGQADNFMLTFVGQINGGSIGPFATINCEPRQARKGAAVTIDASAEMWLLELPPKICENSP